ncbi:6-phosphogluconate dehydrogenase, partial [Aspergillus alliaceus]|uniref:6-phosphogluconate dehydrogenase n=1 Tax=Petromyces alliaceus TaxID=209559 RepID=UPI0012A4C54C
MADQAVADFGLIGLAVMGQNLILNAADHGFTVCAFNRTTSKVDRFLDNEAKGKSIVGAHSIEEFCAKLKRPRRIMLLVMAGKPVDQFIESLLPHLEKGDIIIDGGNSHFPDSNRRTKYLAEKGISFVGSGVSGGEEGARYGPSLMPGGNEAAWPHIKDIFQSIAAKSDGEACCDWVGDEGAGHFVKMVHNGIEYGDMQLICEAYDILKRGVGMPVSEIAEVFEKWNKGVLDSFLIEITRDVLKYNDNDGTPLVEKILDKAGQKGTGKWTAINALDLGMPVTLIGEAVFSRCLSALKDERTRASTLLSGPTPEFTGDKQAFVDDLEQALYASKIISYAQGFMLIQEVSPRSTAGSSTSLPLPSCGVVAVSSAPSSSRISPTPTAATPTLRTFSSTTSSSPPSPRLRAAGETLSARVLSGVSLPPLSALPSASTTDTAPRTFPPTCCRLSVTTSVLTPSASSLSTPTRTTPRARTSTLTGPDAVVTCPPRPTWL